MAIVGRAKFVLSERMALKIALIRVRQLLAAPTKCANWMPIRIQSVTAKIHSFGIH